MITSDYLQSIQKQFAYYKLLGEKTIEQVPDEALFWQYNPESNSICTIVKHLAGNMISRWTDFRTTDGEKEWRQRDTEFENDLTTRAEVMEIWNRGWNCFFTALATIKEDELGNLLYIRNQGHTYMEALNRQLAHYPYHVGQIVFIGKMITDSNWKSLSIPRGESNSFNAGKFAQPKKKAHFTDGTLEKP
jgi:hypothetical protein